MEGWNEESTSRFENDGARGSISTHVVNWWLYFKLFQTLSESDQAGSSPREERYFVVWLYLFYFYNSLIITL